MKTYNFIYCILFIKTYSYFCINIQYLFPRTYQTLNQILHKMENARRLLSTERLAMIKIDAKVNALSARANELNVLGDGMTFQDLTKLQRELQNLEDKIYGWLQLMIGCDFF